MKTDTAPGIGSDPRLSGLPFSLGSIILGKYRIDRVLGAGGMGVIVAGYHAALDQKVAIKILRPHAMYNSELMARFAREARSAAKLRSEHVARVLDVGELENGLPMMVMEYLRGQDLSQLMKERGALSAEEAVDYVLQACEALAEAHAAGIVHRDIKPANIFLTTANDGTPLVKVLDFGVSKLMTRPDDEGPTEGLTQTETVIGSPHYMSPEQLRASKDVDTRADIWGIGAVLYKLLTGEPAFDAGSQPELCVAILVEPLRPIRERKPDLPEGLERVITRCLEKDPNARFASVAELAEALGPFAPSSSQRSLARISRVRSAPSLPPSEPPFAVEAAATDTKVMGRISYASLSASASSLTTGESVLGTKSGLPRSRLAPKLAAAALLATAALVIGVVATRKEPAVTSEAKSAAGQKPADRTPPPEPSPSPPPSVSSANPPATGTPAEPAAVTATARPVKPTAPAKALPPPPSAAVSPAPAAASPSSEFGGRK